LHVLARCRDSWESRESSALANRVVRGILISWERIIWNAALVRYPSPQRPRCNGCLYTMSLVTSHGVTCTLFLEMRNKNVRVRFALKVEQPHPLVSEWI
jgi:hypothetical protein